MSEVTFESEGVLSVDFLNSLHDFMDQEEVEHLNIQTTEGFQILDREQAGFFIRKVQDARAQADQIKAEAESERKRLCDQITRWETAELAKCKNGEDYLTSLLKNFADKELDGKSAKTISLPYGKLAFVKQQDSYEYEDATILDFLEKNSMEEFIQRKPSAKKAVLKKAGTVKDGKLIVNKLVVPGITITPAGPDKFSVTIAKDE